MWVHYLCLSVSEYRQFLIVSHEKQQYRTLMVFFHPFLIRRKNQIPDRYTYLIGIPFCRPVEWIGFFGFGRAMRMHIYISIEIVTVIPTQHIGPTEIGIDQPSLRKTMFVTATHTEHILCYTDFPNARLRFQCTVSTS